MNITSFLKTVAALNFGDANLLASPAPQRSGGLVSPKIFTRLAADGAGSTSGNDNALILTRKYGGRGGFGGVQLSLARGPDSNAGQSLNTASDLWRPTLARNLVDSAGWAYLHTATAKSSTDWAETTQGFATLGNSGYSGNQMKSWDTTVQNATIDFPVTLNADGEFSVGFLTTSTGAVGTVSIGQGTGGSFVSEVLLDTQTFTNKNGSGTRLNRRKYRHRAGAFNVQIKKTDAAANSLRVAGVNLYGLEDDYIPPTATFDAYVTTRDSNDYIANAGERGPAIHNVAANVFGGGYHGGDTAQSAASWVFDGVAQATPAIGTVVAFEDLWLIQDTVVDYGGSNGTWRHRSFQNWGANGSRFGLHVLTTAGFTSGAEYHNMMTASTAFTDILEPIYQAPLTADAQTALGVTDSVTYRNPTTGQMIHMRWKSRRRPVGPWRGAYVDCVTGSYNKMRNGPIQHSTSLAAQSGTVVNDRWTVEERFF